MNNKNLIKWYKENKSKENYTTIFKEHISNHLNCRECGDIVYYEKSNMRCDRDGFIKVEGRTYDMTKNLLGITYHLTLCEDCLIKKHPEYLNINMNKVFNVLNDMTLSAFDIPLDVAKKWKNENYSITLKTLISKYGEDDGNKRWKQYCDKQALTNTFEYKQEKYGWSEKQFKEYNKSRSVTLKNLIDRHGIDKGTYIWNNYIERQRHTCSLNYFITEYGEEVGTLKYNNFILGREINGGYSPISQELFRLLQTKIKYNLQFAEQGGEKTYHDYSLGGNSYYVDCYVHDIDIIIEYNGDLFHANPSLYEANETPNPFRKDKTAQEHWDLDEKRLDFLKSHCNDIIVVWESEYKTKGINKLVEELANKINKYGN